MSCRTKLIHSFLFILKDLQFDLAFLSLQYLTFQNELTSEVEQEEDIASGQTGDDVMSGEITNTCEEENIDAINVDFISNVRQNTCSEKDLDNLRKHFQHVVDNR